MRFAWFKTGIFAALILSAAAAGAQLNPHTNVRWPAVCGTGPGMVYNFQTNTCINVNAINPNTQLTWPANCSNSGNMVYNALNNTCIANGTAANPAGSNTQVQYNQGGIMGAYTNSGLLNFMVPGATVDGSNNVVLPSGVTASKATASVNKVLLITAAPYNAKCDGTTDDQTAIQAAFDAGLSGGQSIQFPAGTCKTGAIVWKGQPFFGAGNNSTTILGFPGQDVFQTPDGNTWTPPANGTLVHDLHILVDNSVDASGSSHGNNTFPNRIAGTLGGTGNIISPAIVPGQVPFGTYNGINVQCSGTIASGTLNQITFSGTFCVQANSGAGLNKLDSWRVIGAPITIKTVGSGGTDLTATITAVSANGTTLTFTPAATSSGSSLSGVLLNPITDDATHTSFWLTVGNCGFAFPNSNGAAASPNLSRFTFQDVSIQSINGPWQGNHSCGMFVQAPPYAMHFNRMIIQGFYAGYAEALPASNPGSSTWTGDTSTFTNMDLTFDLVPMLIMGGNHRTFASVNFYGGAQYQTMGPLWLHPGSSATITRPYFECGLSTGELVRLTGGTSGTGFQIDGGSLGQCLALGYTEWVASNSNVNTQIQPLQIAAGANKNTFANTGLNKGQFTDLGAANSVGTNVGPNPVNAPTPSYLNHPRPPAGLYTGCHIATGNTTTPYLNCEDLITTCYDMGVMFNQPSFGSCVSDPTGHELPLRYFLSVASNTTLDGLNNGGNTNIWSSSYQRTFGTSIPQTPVNVIMTARCVGCTAFSGVLTVKDGTTNSSIGSGTLTFTPSGTDWIRATLSNVDLSSTTYGDILDYRFTVSSNDGTAYQISSIKIEPINTDEHAYLAAKGLPVTGGGNLLPSATTGVLCTGPSSAITPGHIATFNGTNCTLQDGGAIPAAVVTSVPLWMQNYGDGSEGAQTCTSGTCNIQPGEHWYTTCNVSAGAILAAVSSTLGAGAPLVMRCSTSATIAGTISYSINTGSSNGTTTAANYGGASGGGGFGAANGTIGNGYLGAIGAGTAGTSGNAGGNGTATPAYVQKIFLSSGYPYTGTACGGSQGGAGGSSGGAAGRGAGCIIIISPSINFTGTCDVSGQNGVAGGANTGGGGGGAGGICLFRSPSMTNSGTFTVTGGTGGAIGTGTSTKGGDGAAGWSRVFTQ